MRFEVGTVYKISISGYQVPSFGRFVKARNRANGTQEYVFDSLSTDAALVGFALTDEDIVSAVGCECGGLGYGQHHSLCPIVRPEPSFDDCEEVGLDGTLRFDGHDGQVGVPFTWADIDAARAAREGR